MDRHQQELVRGERNSKDIIVTMKPNLSVLLQNIQSIEYKLVSYFSRKYHNHGGSHIYIYMCVCGGGDICTKDLNFFQDIGVEKDFEVSITELVDYGYIIVRIYRSPNSNFWIFLKTLELIMQKI